MRCSLIVGCFFFQSSGFCRKSNDEIFDDSHLQPSRWVLNSALWTVLLTDKHWEVHTIPIHQLGLWQSVTVSSQMPLFFLFRMIDFCLTQLCMRGQEKRCRWRQLMIPVNTLCRLVKKNRWNGWFQKTNSVYDQFQTGGVPGVGLETSDKGSLASDIDPTKDIDPSGQELKVTSFA